MPFSFAVTAVAASVAAACLLPTASGLGVLARLQGVTESGYTCDAECSAALRKLGGGASASRGKASNDAPLILTDEIKAS
jgi:hypothetical protein